MKKIILIILGVIVLLIITAIAIPFLFKDKIVAKAKEEINNNVNAKVNFTDFDLTMISSFPNLTFTLNNLSVIGVDDFKGDTLAYIKTFQVKLSIWDVISGSQIKIKTISLDNCFFNILVLKNGEANYNISKPSTTTSTTTQSSSSFKLDLNDYIIRHTRISYDDESMGFKMTMGNFSHGGHGDFTSDVYDLSTFTMGLTNMWYSGIKYLNNVDVTLLLNSHMDMKAMKFDLTKFDLKLNALNLKMDGSVMMPPNNDINVDLKIGVLRTEFDGILSLVPGVYREGFDKIKATGKVEIDGFVKGTYNARQMPAYALNLKINDGLFKYHQFPMTIKNVNVDLAINNPDGITDHTDINLKNMHVELENDPFDARMHITTPISDANIDGAIKGTVNLGNIKNVIPLDKGSELNGILKADLNMKGRYSSIEKKEYDKFNAAGTLSISGMNYKSADYPATTINSLLLTFNPKNVTLNDLTVQMGKSDIKASGSIDNLLGYYFKKELLKGTFNLSSSLLDLNEMMTGKATTPTAAAPDTTSMSVITLPDNVDFTMNATIGKILYDNFVIDNLKGSVALSKQVLDMQNLAFTMLNGGVKMSGKYSTPNPAKPDFDYHLSLSNFDIQQTAKTFITVQKLAPIAAHANGKFSTDIAVTGTLDTHMQPVYNTLNGGGKLTTQSVTISNFEPLNKIADAIKMNEYKQMQLQNVNVSFTIKDGRVNVAPFETSFFGANAKIQGSNGFDQSIDYTIGLAIPKSKMGSAAQGAISGLLGKANSIAGTNIQLPDPIKVNLLLGGTATKPTIKTDFGGNGKGVTDVVKDQVKQVVTQQIDNGKAAAKAQADKIMADAQAQAQQIRNAAKTASDQTKQQGYAAADKLVSSAGNPIAKVAAQKASDKMKKETDQKAQQIITDGNTNAQKVLDAAKKKSDDLLK